MAYLLIGRFFAMKRPHTRTALLDLAQELAQTRGLNRFSYHDLARGVGIRTASVHHHFPTKEDLGRELMARYRTSFVSALDEIAGRARGARRRLESFTDLFRATLRRGNRLCLCGMLATEYPTLKPSVQREVRMFYEETEAWLARALAEGQESGELQLDRAPAVVAKTFLATLEGAMIAARTFEDEGRLARAGKCFLASLARPTRRRD